MRDNSNSNTVPIGVGLKSVAIVLLAVLTVTLFNTDGRFVTVARDVLPNLDFSEQGRSWRGTSNGIFLDAGARTVVLDRGANRQTFLRQSLKLPVGFGFLRIGSDITVPNQIPGPMWWERAGVLIYSIDEAGKRIPFWPSRIALPEVSDAWQRHEAVIPIAPDAQRMDLYLFTGAKHGAFALRNLTVSGLDNAEWFAAARIVLATGWVAAGLWILVPLVASQWRRLTASLALFVFLGTLAGVMAPQPELSIFLHGVRNVVDQGFRQLPVRTVREAPAPSGTPAAPDDIPENAEAAGEAENVDGDTGISPRGDRAQETTARIIAAMPHALTRDSGAFTAHFSAHAALAFLILLTFRQTAFVHLLGYLLLTGVSTEIIQYFVTTRTVNLTDGALNVVGVVAGAVAGLAWITLARRSSRTA